MLKLIFWPALFLACLSNSALAQITISLQASDASCSSNGSIQVSASGGSGNYTYELDGACLSLPVLQQSPVFNNLPPCDYTVLVTDGTTGATGTQSAQVGGNYQSPELALFCGACTIETSVSGGLAPFQFSISTTGLNGPFETNTPPANPDFTANGTDSIYWIRVTDACGNIAVEACASGSDVIEHFNYEIGNDGNIHVIGLTGGTPPFQYLLQSSSGSYANSTGIFPPQTWGCDMTITVSDDCSELTKTATVRPYPNLICTNFAEGSASIGGIVNGIPPYSVVCVTPLGSFTFDTTEMAGLPVNVDYYQFQVIDACGSKSDVFYKQKKYPVFEQEPATCNTNTVSIFTNEGGCSGGFDVHSWPVQATCLSCSPVQSGTVAGSGDALTFEGNLPGQWELAIEDGCGDHMICRDSVVLEIRTRCDSLKASLIDRFFCENNTISDRPMTNGTAFFILKNENGVTLDANTSGLFHTPAPGAYTISIDLPGCGFFEETAVTGDSQTVDPPMGIFISNVVAGGKCTTVYQLQIDPAEGPYTLTGGPNEISLLIDESYLTTSCLKYSVTNLLPGDYELSPVSNCGIKNIHLPAPDFNLEAVPYGNCPGSGTITASGANDLAYWQAWAAANGVNINWPGNLSDRYSLDAIVNGGNAAMTGSPYVFTNIQPGVHTVYLYTFNAGCAVDTVETVVPEVPLVRYDASSGILCDGAAQTVLSLEIFDGKPPYTIEQLDCNDLNSVIASYATSDSVFNVPNVTLGDYCFRIVDSCVISLDHQFSVQYYQNEVDIIFNCDNTVTFHVDSIRAAFTWLDDSGNILGNNHRLTLPNANPGAVYTVLVDIGQCVIERTVEMPAVEIVPAVQIEGSPYFCEGDTVVLEAISNANEFSWSTGASAPVIATGQAGTYTVTVTNGLGCSTTADFSLSLDLPEVDILVKTGGNGYGLDCFQDSNGVLQALPLAGIPPFVFHWSNLAKTPEITDLPAGEYTVTITDSIGCEATKSITLTQPELFVPLINASPLRCFGADDGSIRVPGWSGGAGIVTASLNGSVSVQVPKDFDHLPPGAYRLEVKDGNGCQVDTGFVFPELQELLLDLGEDLSIRLGDSIHLKPFLNFWPVDSFRWHSNHPAPIAELSPTLTPLESSYFRLQVWDQHGCAVEDKLWVTVERSSDVFVPNAFSPNGDGVNDFFTVYARTEAVRRIRSFEVFTRWGEMVFSKKDLPPNVEHLGWNGSPERRDVMPGVFAWKAEVEFIDGRVEVMFGDVVLVR